MALVRIWLRDNWRYRCGSCTKLFRCEFTKYTPCRPLFCAYYTESPPPFLFPSCDILKWLPALKIHEHDQLSVNGGAWLLVALRHFRAITLQWFNSGQALERDLVAGKVHTAVCAKQQQLVCVFVADVFGHFMLFLYQVYQKSTRIECNLNDSENWTVHRSGRTMATELEERTES